MKKIVMSLLVICTMFFMTNASMACDCGCSDKAKIDAEIGCPKNCDCGCKSGDECKCGKAQCPKKECCKKCPCGCKNGEDCKCKKECAKQFDKAKCDKTKCDKEKSLLDEIKDSTATEEISTSPDAKCGCKKEKITEQCPKVKSCKKSKKCKKVKKECKKGCPLEDIVE